MRIVVDKEKCTGCGECKQVCPKGEVIWKVEDGKAKASKLEYCHVCTLCASKCPEGAIRVIRDGQNGEEEEVNQENK